jgi:hypothetical protein
MLNIMMVTKLEAQMPMGLRRQIDASGGNTLSRRRDVAATTGKKKSSVSCADLSAALGWAKHFHVHITNREQLSLGYGLR